ncbi:MAG: metallophosphoesterase family protein [Myxococcales bacterium]|nr:metallophosphoesterase family protein [Myxococcales bacterium]
MPTITAFLSDVHGDLHALRDALRLLDAMDVREIVCLGDVLDYGIFPDETLALLAARLIPTLRGNHDRWCLTNKSVGTNATDLTPASRRFLKTTVPSWSATIEGVRVAAHHARPGSDMNGVMPDATADDLHEVLKTSKADIVVVGHTHRAMELRLGDQLVLNPGALLRDPADGWERELPTPGTFGVLELPARKWTVIRARTGKAVEIVRTGR